LGTAFAGYVENLQSLPEIDKGLQSTPDSPPKTWVLFEAYCFADICGDDSAAASTVAFSVGRNSCLQRLIFCS
jgi:hypothetical protein